MSLEHGWVSGWDGTFAARGDARPTSLNVCQAMVSTGQIAGPETANALKVVASPARTVHLTLTRHFDTDTFHQAL